MKNYSAQEVLDIAAESEDEYIIERFTQYVAAGWFDEKPKTIKPAGKFKPFLAAKAKLEQVKNFPVWAGLKYDGIRGILHSELGPITRTAKPIPNVHITVTLEANASLLSDLDGEIITYTKGKKDSFNTIQSKVMTEEGNPEFKVVIFDDFEFPEKPYAERMANAARKIAGNPIFVLGEYKQINNAKELAEYEEYCAANSEGMIVRNPNAAYKFGASTLREAGLLKIKRFMDDEAEIIDVIQNSKGEEMVGALVVLWKKKVFNIGNGWTDDLAKELWRVRHTMRGQKATFSYQELSAKGIPRFASFTGIRRDI